MGIFLPLMPLASEHSYLFLSRKRVPSLMKTVFHSVVSTSRDAVLSQLFVSFNPHVPGERGQAFRLCVVCSAVRADGSTSVLPPIQVIITTLSTSRKPWRPELPAVGGFGFKELVREIQGPSEVKLKTSLQIRV